MKIVNYNINSEFEFRKLFDLQGKVAVVTGGTGLLGREFVNGLAEFGADVVIIDIRTEEGEIQTKEVEGKFGVRSQFITCDVTDEQQVINAIQETINRFSKIDILINNVAAKSENLDHFFATFEEYSSEEWRTILDINLTGMFLVAREVGKHMKRIESSGSIIQVGSVYGLLAPDQRIYEGSEYLGRPINSPAVYSASKAGVIGLSKYLAAYWGPSRIRVNTLIPGGVFSGQNETFVEKYSNRVPLGRMAHATEIASAAIFLASDASRYITGQELVVDGGLASW
jgi:NAD(P)-dependent dehydrogenase (short-subunit alcohol dehydrogenase family)